MPYAPFNLSDKTVLVTGANAGIGAGMADALAAAGARLVIWGRRADRNDTAAARFRQHGVEVLTDTVDIADENQVDIAFARAVEKCGVIHAVFANAGRSGPRTPFENLDTNENLEVLKTNQLGTMYTVRAAARHMLDVVGKGGKGGSIIITGSSSMLWGAAGNAAYAMTKGALDALVRTIAVEYGKHGIRVNSILPGLIYSEFGQTASTSAWIEANCSMKRGGDPSEVGGLAVYFASDASSYHTGDSILIDGGLCIQKGPA